MQRDTESRTRNLMKRQALLSGFGSLFSALIYFAVDFPFPAVVAAIAAAAAVCYFSYYLLFDLIVRTCYAGAGAALSVMGIAALSLVVHYTGGLVSPFIFFYFCILILEALYGLRNPLTLPLAVAGYLSVVAGQFSGVLQSANVWATEFYRSPAATFLMAAVTVFNLALARGVTRLIVSNLREAIAQEGQENGALLRRFSELDSTAQIGVLAHRIAHDLRGPMASISGYIEIEMAKDKSPEEKEALRDLSETVTGMADALHGITRFGRAGGPASERIHLADFMRDLLAIVQFSPQARGVKFIIAGHGEGSPCVNASRADLQQAFFNILKNAVEAVSGAPGPGEIEISLAAEGEEARIAVSDSGPGLAREAPEMLFRKSFTTKKDGTGVGLIITRDLLLRNRGEIALRNREKGGLTVTVSLPAA